VHLEHRELKEELELQDPKVQLELTVFQELRDQLELKDQSDHQDLLDLQDWTAWLVTPVSMEYLD